MVPGGRLRLKRFGRKLKTCVPTDSQVGVPSNVCAECAGLYLACQRPADVVATDSNSVGRGEPDGEFAMERSTVTNLGEVVWEFVAAGLTEWAKGRFEAMF